MLELEVEKILEDYFRIVKGDGLIEQNAFSVTAEQAGNGDAVLTFIAALGTPPAALEEAEDMVSLRL